MNILHVCAGPSVRLLRTYLNTLTDEQFLITRNPDRVRGQNLIRYGNSTVIQGITKEINPPNIVSTLAFKNRFSADLLANDIYSVEFFRNQVPQRFPVLIRETLTSYGGRGIHLARNEQEFNSLYNRGFWWTPFIRTQFELRVHILGGEVKRIFKKEYIGDDQEQEFPIRNMHRGYHFSLRNINNYPKVITLVNTIVERVTGKNCFFALDVGWDAEKKEYLVFEGNSSPGLNQNEAQVYGDFIGNFFGWV